MNRSGEDMRGSEVGGGSNEAGKRTQVFVLKVLSTVFLGAFVALLGEVLDEHLLCVPRASVFIWSSLCTVMRELREGRIAYGSYGD